MKKDIQKQINEHIKTEEEKCLNEYENALMSMDFRVYKMRLYNCQAWVYETDNYIILKSYSTIVACYDKNYNTLYDFLRDVYGYTATSAQHIAKFVSMMRYYRSSDSFTIERYYPL